MRSAWVSDKVDTAKREFGSDVRRRVWPLSPQAGLHEGHNLSQKSSSMQLALRDCASCRWSSVATGESFPSWTAIDCAHQHLKTGWARD